ncbi:hypothetical protein [Nocardiopsis sp. YSL2]|uniref:hypothetical protein n=1 Tax=Nocardiopsis sp. YSL2 TaxID=2939492 RepID=UPI0026F453DF|nr:hypothetical protein [Nocardiopsis sp. YSL2]
MTESNNTPQHDQESTPAPTHPRYDDEALKVFLRQAPTEPASAPPLDPGAEPAPEQGDEETPPDTGGGEEPGNRVSASGITSNGDGDVLVAGGNVTKIVRQYIRALAKLPSRAIDGTEIVPDHLFAPIGDLPRADSGVYVLAGTPGTGRRAAALRLLTALPEHVELRELRPDWEEPDVERIPLEPRTGYLLDLTGTLETVPEQLRGDLAGYATRAREDGSLLVILGDEHAWGTRKVPWGHHRIAARDHRRPDAVEVARLRLQHSQHPDRAAWIDQEDSSFHDLLVPDAPPERGVDLARIVLDAEGAWDETAKDRFLGWRTQIREWFAGDVRQENGKAVEKRTLRIAAAFLDGAPAQVVLNSADLLVPQQTRERFEELGGALAGPDDQTRCDDAGVTLRDGRVYVTDSRKGLDLALIHYLWAKRGSLATKLTDWLADISAPDGHAEASLERLSDILTEVAVVQGKDAVLPLVHAWLQQGSQRRTGFAVKVLDHLAVHPVLGSPVRAELSNWAKGTTTPDRQRAVIEVGKREFGETYPKQALTRLRYVLEKTQDPGLWNAAVAAAAQLLARESSRLVVLKVLVDWVEDGRTADVAGRLFLSLFDGRGEVGEEGATDPARGLLHLEGAEGDAAQDLLRDAWWAVWKNGRLREEASLALNRWQEATSDGILPVDATYKVVIAVCNARSLDPDLDRLVQGDDPVSARLRQDFWARPDDDHRNGEPEGVSV